MSLREGKKKSENYFIHPQDPRYECETLSNRNLSAQIPNDEVGGSRDMETTKQFP